MFIAFLLGALLAADPEMDNVNRIRERIVAHASHQNAVEYQVTIPNTTISYDMVPIPGSDPFWMQAHEVTWDEYRLFMFAKQGGETTHKDEAVDAVSRPTRPYVEMSFGMGIDGFPAISMTEHAANKYAEWLSAKTGEFYRLPTEAEWEYACEAGAKSQPSPLKDYAWFTDNSNSKYQKVGSKKPNAWGLFDMLGNVKEWTLQGTALGGSWIDPADKVTCTSRTESDPAWKEEDPQLPKSVWYETDAMWLGFRLIRPAKLPTAEEMYKYWNTSLEKEDQ